MLLVFVEEQHTIDIFKSMLKMQCETNRECTITSHHLRITMYGVDLSTISRHHVIYILSSDCYSCVSEHKGHVVC